MKIISFEAIESLAYSMADGIISWTKSDSSNENNIKLGIIKFYYTSDDIHLNKKHYGY